MLTITAIVELTRKDRTFCCPERTLKDGTSISKPPPHCTSIKINEEKLSQWFLEVWENKRTHRAVGGRGVLEGVDGELGAWGRAISHFWCC